MFDIAFGLLFFHILSYATACLFVLFVLVPIALNLATQDGYRANCGRVWRFLRGAFSMAFGKTS